MSLDRLHRQVWSAGDLLVLVTAGDQLQYFALTRSQVLELRVVADTGAVAERVEDETGEARREDRVALADTSNRVPELFARDRLRHVASRAGADHADHIFCRV